MTTRTITLTKHHALGNDFLITFDAPVDEAFARQVCDRRRGIGADGLIVGSEESDGEVRMVVLNADGSRAEMSGNGIRCFAQAISLRRGDAGTRTILTDAGERLVTLRPTEDPLTIEATVDMGAIEEIDEPAGWSSVGTHPDRPVAHLSVGNPHTVVGVDDVAGVDLLAIGSQVPHVNVEIVEPGPEPDAVTMRVHERGAGVTEACGTGACAVAWAASRWGLVSPGATELVVHMDGGTARVALDQPVAGRATLTGPASHIATIEIPRP